MKSEILDMIITMRGMPCITIIIPVDRNGGEKVIERFKKDVRRVHGLFNSADIDANVRESIEQELDNIKLPPPASYQKGVGVYITKAGSFVVPFPFDVDSRVVVRDQFQMSELAYLQQYFVTHYVLSLNSHGVWLYRSKDGKLSEVSDGYFPLHYLAEYHFQSAPQITDGATTVEEDKTKITAIRVQSVMREADTHLRQYLTDKAVRIVLAGTQKRVHMFTSMTAFSDNVLGKVNGNFNENDIKQLEEAEWHVYLKLRKSALAASCQNILSREKAHIAGGLIPAWRAVVAGKAQALLLEQGYHHKAFTKTNRGELYLQSPSRPYEEIDDAVDELARLVRSQHRDLILVERDQLKDMGHVAVILKDQLNVS